MGPSFNIRALAKRIVWETVGGLTLVVHPDHSILQETPATIYIKTFAYIYCLSAKFLLLLFVQNCGLKNLEERECERASERANELGRTRR
jgi:hypothetical protein